AQILHDRVVAAREEAPVAVIRLFRDRRAALGHAIGEGDLLRVAARVAAMALEPLDPVLEPGHRVEPECRVGADRIPAVAELRGAAQGRTAFAADPYRDPLLYRARLEEHVGEFDVFAVERRVFVGPQLAAGEEVFVGDGAALVKRVGPERLELLAAPPCADT